MIIFSSQEELKEITQAVRQYMRLPFANDAIPGAVLEGILAKVHKGKRLGTYDFVDVVLDSKHFGWQVKSTKSGTPVTWKRAKIPNQDSLIKRSRKSPAGLKALGDAIIGFCNAHAAASLKDFNLDAIGYARLLVFPNGRATYFERILCTKTKPRLFDPDDYEWKWSQPKKTVKKEQLQALHGTHEATGEKHWAWHGLGENQLHFSGESIWWPQKGDSHLIEFLLPTTSEKLSYESFISLLSQDDV